MTAHNIYWIDSRDRIIRVSEAWDDFAMANNGDGTRGESVIGKRLWRFIQGDATRMWLDAILGQARISGNVLVKPYRCDSPTLKRFMQMTVCSDPYGGVRLEHELLRTEAMDAAVEVRFALDHFPETILRCSICNKLNIGKQWHEPDDTAVQRRLVAGSPLKIAFGVCDDCLQLSKFN